jgi:predicted amidophosphoribosyltransferase
MFETFQKTNSPVYGSRFLHRVKLPKNMKLKHAIANLILTAVTNFFNKQKLTDMMTCHKMVARVDLQRMRLSENGFNIEPEITTKLARIKKSIVEIPVEYSARDISQGKKIKAIDFFKCLCAIVRAKCATLKAA